MLQAITRVAGECFTSGRGCLRQSSAYHPITDDIKCSAGGGHPRKGTIGWGSRPPRCARQSEWRGRQVSQMCRRDLSIRAMTPLRAPHGAAAAPIDQAPGFTPGRLFCLTDLVNPAHDRPPQACLVPQAVMTLPVSISVDDHRWRRGPRATGSPRGRTRRRSPVVAALSPAKHARQCGLIHMSMNGRVYAPSARPFSAGRSYQLIGCRRSVRQRQQHPRNRTIFCISANSPLVPRAAQSAADEWMGAHARQCFVRRSSLMQSESTPSIRLMIWSNTSSGCRVALDNARASLFASARLATAQWKSTIPW